MAPISADVSIVAAISLDGPDFGDFAAIADITNARAAALAGWGAGAREIDNADAGHGTALGRLTTLQDVLSAIHFDASSGLPGDVLYIAQRVVEICRGNVSRGIDRAKSTPPDLIYGNFVAQARRSWPQLSGTRRARSSRPAQEACHEEAMSSRVAVRSACCSSLYGGAGPGSSVRQRHSQGLPRGVSSVRQ